MGEGRVDRDGGGGGRSCGGGTDDQRWGVEVVREERGQGAAGEEEAVEMLDKGDLGELGIGPGKGGVTLTLEITTSVQRGRGSIVGSVERA